MTIGVQAALANGPQNDARGSLSFDLSSKISVVLHHPIFIVDAMDID